MWCWLHDDIFNRSDRTPGCDVQTDGWTDRVVLVFDPNCPSMKTVHKYVALSRLHQKHYDIVKRQVAAQAHSVTYYY